MCDLRRSANALGCERQFVRCLLAARTDIFDRATRKSDVSRQPNCFSNVGRLISVAIFKVRAHGQIGCCNESRRMTKHRFAIDRAIRLSDRKRKSGARRCQRLEAERLQQPRGADVPRIGNDERTIALMQRAKGCSLFCLSCHQRTKFSAHFNGNRQQMINHISTAIGIAFDRLTAPV